MAEKTSVMAVILENRVETATRVQEVLTQFGCHIRTRLGLHQASADACSNQGLILLQLFGEDAVVQQLTQDLLQIPTVKVNSMELDL
nr:hypothetical protein [uncultured Anaeromusa sp.]